MAQKKNIIGFKGMNLWGEMKTTTNLTKIRAKGIRNFKGTCYRCVPDFKNYMGR